MILTRFFRGCPNIRVIVYQDKKKTSWRWKIVAKEWDQKDGKALMISYGRLKTQQDAFQDACDRLKYFNIYRDEFDYRID